MFPLAPFQMWQISTLKTALWSSWAKLDKVMVQQTLISAATRLPVMILTTGGNGLTPCFSLYVPNLIIALCVDFEYLVNING